MNTNICPTCKSSIPATAPGGFCPACILRDAEELPPAGRAAPSLAEVGAAFPQLEVLELIGQGGMGFVYKVRQPSLDRTVALKILSPELSSDPAFAERFAREARVLGKLNHPNIVTVFESGVALAPPPMNDQNAAPGIKFFYLIMEHVDGVNLRQAMRAGRFTPAQALAVVPGICDALQAAHAQGVWHRDIKPENILLDAQGGVKIVDFGIARIVGDPQRDFTLTMTGAALGSAAYMAPEQHEKPHDVDHRADIYSLGVVIYEMLTGELPLGRFKAPSTKAAVDARIDEIVFRTLEKERELRQQSAAEVKTEMASAATRPAPAREAAGPAGQPSKLTLWSLALMLCGAIIIPLGIATHDAVTYSPTGGSQRIFGWLLIGLGALALTLGMAGCYYALWQMHHGNIPPVWRPLLRIVTVLPGLHWLWFEHLRRAVLNVGPYFTRHGAAFSSATPGGLKSGTTLALASKAALIGGIVLFVAAAVFTYGSTQGVLLAIAATAFVLGGLGLLFGGGAPSALNPSAAAPVTVRSLWLFLAGITAVVAGAIVYNDAPYVPVHMSGLQMKPVLVRDPSALKLGRILFAVGGVVAFAGWCGLWYALSLMKRGVISTTLRGFARTFAWLPVVFLAVAALSWTKVPNAAENAEFEAARREREKLRVVEQTRYDAETAQARLKTRFPDLSTPQGAVVAYAMALEARDTADVLAAIPSSVVAKAVRPGDYARELIADHHARKIVKEDVAILVFVGTPENGPGIGAMDAESQKRILGRDPAGSVIVEYRLRLFGKNPGIQSSNPICVKEGAEWRVIPRMEPSFKFAAQPKPADIERPVENDDGAK